MRLLRFIWGDILWFNSIRPAVKITALMFVFVLTVGAWYLGAEWWSTPTLQKGQYHPRAGVAGAILITTFIVYIIYAIDRYRKSS